MLGFDDVPLLLELVERVTEAGGAYSAGFFEVAKRQGCLGLVEDTDELFGGRRRFGSLGEGGLLNHPQGKFVVVAVQSDGDIGGGGCGAVLDSEGELGSLATEIEIGVSPGVELGAATQGLAGAELVRAFSGMVDKDDGELIAALELAQISEKRGDLVRGVFVDAMQSHEGVEE